MTRVEGLPEKPAGGFAAAKEDDVMRVRLRRLAMLLACVAVSATASAQFGHPLKGTWSGDWGVTSDSRTHVLIDIRWDSKGLTGTLNPGPNAIPLQKLTLDTDNWTVHLEGDGKDKSGATVHYVIDGKVENLGSARRSMTGAWAQGSLKGDFRVTRN
jgi:hypothetical protein